VDRDWRRLLLLLLAMGSLAGVALVRIGSSYYHWVPTNQEDKQFKLHFLAMSDNSEFRQVAHRPRGAPRGRAQLEFERIVHGG
jgi:hypothetical protein